MIKLNNSFDRAFANFFCTMSTGFRPLEIRYFLQFNARYAIRTCNMHKGLPKRNSKLVGRKKRGAQCQKGFSPFFPRSSRVFFGIFSFYPQVHIQRLIGQVQLFLNIVRREREKTLFSEILFKGIVACIIQQGKTAPS